jgi:hypothetical protein
VVERILTATEDGEIVLAQLKSRGTVLKCIE